MNRAERDRLKQAAATSKMMKKISQPPSTATATIAPVAAKNGLESTKTAVDGQSAPKKVPKPKKPRKTLEDHEALARGRGRFPVGIRIEMTYHGDDKWTGQLHIPHKEGDIRLAFQNESSSSFRLQHELTLQYCEFLKQQKGEVK